MRGEGIIKENGEWRRGKTSQKNSIGKLEYKRALLLRAQANQLSYSCNRYFSSHSLRHASGRDRVTGFAEPWAVLVIHRGPDSVTGCGAALQRSRCERSRHCSSVLAPFEPRAALSPSSHVGSATAAGFKAEGFRGYVPGP